ncbi:MAG: Holliday junction branch migration DNA helicase RuvB [Aquificae bacterium]|nr:Holliday junction branch migration DNA helicase RuvB [Aquificota bacterium]
MAEEKQSISVRPQSLDEYIGQENIKKQVKVFIQASKRTGKPLDHTLITGPPGLGKTTLAQVIANELGKEIVFTSGTALEKKGDLAGILSSLQEGDILFIDEIHRLNPAVEEMLYPAIEDFHLDIVIGKGTTAKTVRLNLPQFTLIGATTKAGMLTQPLLSRFGIILNMDFYDIKSLTQIVIRSASILGIQITPEGAEEIAKSSRGTPRIANRLLRRVYDYAVIHNNGIVDKETSRKALAFLGIDSNGLDQIDRKYLSLLVNTYSGKPVGLNTLSSALGETKRTIEEVIEPYLIQQGLVKKTPRGRVATDKAIKLFGEL